MDICGNIYVAKNIMSFSLKCTYCEKEVEQWDDFVYHIHNFHNPMDEMWIDPLEGSKISILVEDIKQEEEMDMCILEDDKSENWIAKEESTPPSISDSNDKDDEESDSAETTDSDEDVKLSNKFNPSFYRRSNRTLEFIELFRTLPCLWDPNNVNYRNFPKRSEAHKEIIQSMKQKFRITLAERGLIASIKKIRKEYFAILQLKKKPNTKISSVALEYFEKCSFLNVIDESPEDATNECDNTKYLAFGKSNEVTLAFIDAYARFPVLYDPNHSDYTNITTRKQAYGEMANALKTDHNAVFTEEELYKGIYNLRQWYYKARDRLKKGENQQSMSDAQKMYLERCSFLPPKVLKKKMSCELCGKVLHNETTLQVHMYKEHQMGDLPHKCPNCERTFEQKSAMQMHQQRSHLGKVHQCEHCVRRFAVLVDLQRHIRTHTGERPFVCELCGKAFASKAQLGYHTAAIHTKIRAFKCTMCPKDFLKHRDLKDHIKAHLNIRDKICETCGKGFTNCHSLIRHRQIHSEVKKFACKLCDAKFHQFVGLNAHMKRTHNIVKNKANN